MQYSRLIKSENPNNPMSDTLRFDDWVYGQGNPLNTPFENYGDFDPSSQPYTLNTPDGSSGIMISNTTEDDIMNPIGDLDKVTSYETSVCVEGDINNRILNDNNTSEDSYAWYNDGMCLLKRNPYDPLNPTEIVADETSYDYFNKQKNNTNVNLFPGITYPTEQGSGVGQGYPGYQVSPALTYPGLF